MQVTGIHAHESRSAAMRHPLNGRGVDKAVAAAAALADPPPAPGAVIAPDAAAPATETPVESTVEMAARKRPPGLVRVAARFEALGAEGRSGGQSNALAQITRNLQRYVDTQGIAAPAPAPATETPEASLPAVDPLAPELSTEPVMPVSTPAVDDAGQVDALLVSAAATAEPARV